MKKSQVKLVLLVLVIAAMAAGIILGTKYLKLENVKRAQGRFEQWYAADPWVVLGGFVLFYIIMATLGVPAAGAVTMLAGALFGLVVGTVSVLIASTIGATGSFLMARFLLRDWVQSRFGERLRVIHEGVRREGALYLFTMRMIPLFPYFAINLVMGLTPMKTWTFFWVSLVGMIAGTIVLVNAGAQLATIESLEDVFSFRLIGSFALLGLFPLAGKKTMEWIRRKRC